MVAPEKRAVKTQVRAKTWASGRKSKRHVAVLADLTESKHRLGGEGDVVVGEDGALGYAGGSRGVDDGGDVAGLDIGDPGFERLVGDVAAELEKLVKGDDPVVGRRRCP